MTPKNIHKIFIPPKLFIFSEPPHPPNMEIQNLNLKKWPKPTYENIRAPPWESRQLVNTFLDNSSTDHETTRRHSIVDTFVQSKLTCDW